MKVSYDNGETYEKITGKYEAMAQCLGCMAHYIADCTYPGHIIDHFERGALASWNKHAREDFNSVFSQNTYTNGGPDWRSFDFANLNIFPEIPYFAASHAGKITFDGSLGLEWFVTDDQVYYDSSDKNYLFLNPNAANNLPGLIEEGQIVPREGDLLNLAVHKTANALAFMLEKCLNNTQNEDTIEKRGIKKEIIILNEIELEVPNRMPIEYQDIEDILKWDSRDTDRVNGLTSALQVGLTSLFGLVIIALFEEILKKVISESPTAIT